MLAGEPSVGWESNALVDDAELTEASDDLLIADALLRGVPGRERDSFCWLSVETAPPLGEGGAMDASDDTQLWPRRIICSERKNC